MNRLQYRHAFAMRYFERTGNYMVGWLLSRAAADNQRRSAKFKQMKAKLRDNMSPDLIRAIALHGLVRGRDPRIINIDIKS